MESNNQHLRLQEIAGDLEIVLKREDLIHPDISGNKWRKLKYNLQYAKANSYKTLLTYGGAYSNHLAAVAAAGYQYGFTTHGIVRGDELEGQSLNPTSNIANKWVWRCILSVDRCTRTKNRHYQQW